jgi:hypothetical protein
MKNTVIKSCTNLENSGSLLTKKRLFKSILTILFIIVMFPLSSSAQKCSLILTAENNIESVNSEGRVYFIQLENKSSEALNVKLSLSNNNTGKNPDLTLSSRNVSLNAAIILENDQNKQNLKINANEVVKFQVKVTVPAGTPIERWNNIVLTASTEECSNYSTSLTLYTFIPDPEAK